MSEQSTDEELSAEEESRNRIASRRRTGKILIVAFLVFIAVMEVVTFVSRSQNAARDARADLYYGSAASYGANYVEVQARILDISAATATELVRLTITPHGLYSTRDGALSVPMNLDADGYSGGSIDLAAGVIPPPVPLTLDLNGDLSQYPLDQYNTLLTVDLAPIRLKPNGTYSLPETTSIVPMRLVEVANQHDWVTSSALQHRWEDGSITITLGAHRGTATVGFAFFELFMMVALATIAVAITFAAIVSDKPLEFSLFAWLGAMLFALPAIRGTMPGIPSVGTVVDYSIFFWCLIAIAGCLIVAAITYIRASWRAHHMNH